MRRRDFLGTPLAGSAVLALSAQPKMTAFGKARSTPRAELRKLSGVDRNFPSNRARYCLSTFTTK
jgi:hypothetical protein